MPPSVLPTGVTRYDPERAHGYYVLFDGRNADSFLIDMNGTEINHWPYSGFPVEMIDPDLADGVRGRILAQKEPGIFENETLIELDWNGTIVWEWGRKSAPAARRDRYMIWHGCRMGTHSFWQERTGSCRDYPIDRSATGRSTR